MVMAVSEKMYVSCYHGALHITGLQKYDEFKSKVKGTYDDPTEVRRYGQSTVDIGD